MATDEHIEILTQYVRSNRARCPTCGYDLRELSGTICPECGSTLRLRLDVASRVLPVDWWIGMLGVALGLLFGLFLLASVSQPLLTVLHDPALPMMVSAGMASASDLPDWSLIAFAAGWCIATIAAIGAMLGVRLRWSSWTLGRRLPIVLAGLLMPAMLLGLLAWWYA